jgi:hypothetical protein
MSNEILIPEYLLTEGIYLPYAELKSDVILWLQDHNMKWSNTIYGWYGNQGKTITLFIEDDSDATLFILRWIDEKFDYRNII